MIKYLRSSLLFFNSCTQDWGLRVSGTTVARTNRRNDRIALSFTYYFPAINYKCLLKTLTHEAGAGTVGCLPLFCREEWRPVVFVAVVFNRQSSHRMPHNDWRDPNFFSFPPFCFFFIFLVFLNIRVCIFGIPLPRGNQTIIHAATVSLSLPNRDLIICMPLLCKRPNKRI